MTRGQATPITIMPALDEPGRSQCLRHARQKPRIQTKSSLYDGTEQADEPKAASANFYFDKDDIFPRSSFEDPQLDTTTKAVWWS